MVNYSSCISKHPLKEEWHGFQFQTPKIEACLQPSFKRVILSHRSCCTCCLYPRNRWGKFRVDSKIQELHGKTYHKQSLENNSDSATQQHQSVSFRASEHKARATSQRARKHRKWRPGSQGSGVSFPGKRSLVGIGNGWEWYGCLFKNIGGSISSVDENGCLVSVLGFSQRHLGTNKLSLMFLCDKPSEDH